MAGGFDKNKDYAAAIKNEKDPGKRNQLISERQNKINWMNSTGQNKNGYSNSIYGSKYSTISEKGGSSGGGSRGGWGGYSEPDYAAIAAEARREANMAATFASMNAAKIGMDNAAMEAAMKNTNDTYSGFNKATVDNTRSETAINPAAYTFRNFDPNRDYAAEIAKETDPAKRAQLKQERQNKIDWMTNAGTNKGGYTNDIYKNDDDSASRSPYTQYYRDYTQGWSLDSLGKGSRADLNNRVNDIRNAMRINSAAYAGADPATRKQLAAENQAYADQLNRLGVSVRQFEPGGSWYYTDRMVLQGDPYDSEYGYYKFYDVPEDYDMFVNNNEYADQLYASDPKTETGMMGEWGDWFMNAADMQAGAVDAQLKALQEKLAMQRGENNSYYDDIASQAYIAKRQAEAAMPQRLAAYGISGGGSESAQLGLDTSYQNNINANELARQNMLQELDYQNILAQSQANSDKANIYAQAQKDAYNAYLQQQQMQQQQEQWQWERDAWLKEFNQNNERWDKEFNYGVGRDEAQDRFNMIDYFIAMHNWAALDKMGIDTSYMRRQDAYETAQQALKASKSSGRSSSGGSSRSRSTYSSGGSTGSGGIVNAAAADKDSLGRITSLYRMAMTSPFQSEDEKAAFFENQVAREIQNGNISKEAFDYWNKTQVIGVAGMR